jgi:uncharacterized protein
MRRKLKTIIASLSVAFLLLPASLAALDAPAMNGAVNDLAGVIGTAEKAELSNYLDAVNAQTGVQVAVLTVASLEGDSIEAFSMRVAEEWKLGQADKDNGALLVVAVAERSLRIEVGYGLEGELTDMKTGLIIRNVIVPYFKGGNYGGGIIAGVRNIVGIATGDASIVAQAVQNPQTRSGSSSGSGFAGIIFFIFFILSMLGGIGRRRHGGGGGLLGALLLGTLLGSGRSGRSGGGFGGGGGFSGGGGSFGGGGSSGSW